MRLGVEDIDRIDWMSREDAAAMFEAYPGLTMTRPSAHGYRLLELRVPADLAGDQVDELSDDDWLG